MTITYELVVWGRGHEGDWGHFYVELKKIDNGVSVSTFSGLYASSDASNAIYAEGVIEDEEAFHNNTINNQNYNYISESYSLSQAEYDSAAQYVNMQKILSDNGELTYAAFTNNCTHFVQDVYEAAGQTGSFRSGITSAELQQLNTAGLFADWFQGDYAAGEDILLPLEQIINAYNFVEGEILSLNAFLQNRILDSNHLDSKFAFLKAEEDHLTLPDGNGGTASYLVVNGSEYGQSIPLTDQNVIVLGGGALDMAHYGNLSGGIGVNVNLQTGVATHIGSSEIIGYLGDAIAHVTGSIYNDIITGGAEGNTLIGDIGNDTLVGGADFDTYILAPDGSVDTIIDSDRDGVIQWRGKTTVNLTGEAEYESGDEWSLSKDGVDFKLKTVNGNLEVYVDNTKVGIIQDFVEAGKEPHESTFGQSTYELSLEDPDDDDDDSGSGTDDTIDEIDNLFSQADQSGHTDPLVLDLDGDGIEVYRNQTVQFDIDGDGQLETVGWIQSDDGFLVRDINANGVIDDINELYGNATQLGFDELREDEALFSQNADSLINAQDGQFYDDLLIWRDLNSDGVSQANELSSLADNGITEIDIRSTSILQDGRWIGNNLISEISFYEDAVNGPQEIAEVFFMMDDPSGSYNQPGNLYEGTDPTVLALPQQRGYGQLASLQEAMENDSTLLSMVQGLSQITDDAGLFRDSVVDILYRWADAEAIDPNSRGGNFDARSLLVLEKVLGRSFGANGDPNGRAVGLLEHGFDLLVNTIESRFMVQSIFSDIFPHAEYSFLTDSLHLNDDFASVAARLDSSAFSEDIGFVFKIYKILLENQSSLGTTTTAINEYLATTLTGIFGDDAFIAQLIASFESDYVVYGEGNFTGTFRDELVLSQGHGDTISGGDGSDILIGSSGDDSFTGELIRPPSGGAYLTLSDDTAFGGDGEDTFHVNSVRDSLLMGGDGDDTFSQGTIHNSTLVGGNGADYVRAQGSDNIVLGGEGNDRLHAYHTAMTMARNFVDLGEGNDTIESGSKYHSSTILGGDGDDTFISLSLAGTYVDGGRGNDTITTYGFGGYNTIHGGDGDDVITAHVGNYTIDGGEGNDTIQGSNGHLNVIIGQYANTTDEISVTSYNYNLSHIDITAFTGINYLSDLEVEEISGEDYGWVISLPDNQKIILRSEVDLDLEDFFIFSDVPPSIEETGTSANEVLQGDAGTDTLDGAGGSDTIYGGNGNDSITGGDNSASDGADVLYGEGGDDSIFGGYHHDFLYGGDGNDTLDGGVSNDLLDGGNGDDSLIGGSGNDTLIGGAGMDTFVGGTGNDVITVEVDDYLVVDAGGGADIVNGSAANDTIIGGDNSSADGADVLYGHDGNDSIFGGYHHDSLYGGDGNDTLDGGVSNDLLDGGNGDDSLIGGAGNDTLIGGAGMDTFVGGTGNDVITVEADDYLVVDAGGGADIVNGSAANDTIIGGDNSSADGADVLYGHDGNDSIFGGYHHDSLYGGDGNDTLDGGVSNDLLDGGNGDDSLIGGSGNDTLVGGAGMDTFVGGTGNDVITVEVEDYLVADAGGGADVVNGSALGDTIIGGDNTSADGADELHGNDGNDSIFGGYHHDSLYGGDGNDTLDGGVSNDLLDGGNGDDSLIGGSGNDTLIGGAGMDTFVGGTGDDVITVEADDYLVVDAGGGADIVNGSAASDTIIGGDNTSADGADVLYGNDGNDSIFGGYHHDSLYGGEGNDTLDGGVSNDLLDGGNGDDSLIGGAGNDTLIGGAGMDTFVGGTGDDVITVEVDDYLVVDAGGGADIVNGSAASDTIIGGDNTSADGADALYGNDGDDSIFGGYHHDSLYGGEDNDTLDGGVSNDLLDGGNGDDSLIGGSGNDTLIGGAGMDTFVGGTGDDVITVEADDYLVIDAGGGADVVHGSSANDTIIGGENNSSDGQDVLYGNDGDDSIFGGYHHDQLFGGSGADTLDGGVSHDTLDGGMGADLLTGGAGDDIFIFSDLLHSTATAQDTIADFMQGADHIDLTALGFTGIQSGVADGDMLGFSVVGGKTVIEADDSDFSIVLTGDITLTNDDFVF